MTIPYILHGELCHSRIAAKPCTIEPEIFNSGVKPLFNINLYTIYIDQQQIQ